MISEQHINQQTAQLQFSEELYRMLFEGAHDAILILSDGICVDCNCKTLSVFGYSNQNEIIGNSLWHFTPRIQMDGSDSQTKISDSMIAAPYGSSRQFYWKMVKHNGDLFDAEVLLTSATVHGRSFIQAVIRDITDRMATEAALLESEEEYRKLILTVPEVIIKTDLDGNIKFINETVFPSMKWLSKERLLGNNIFSFISHEDKARAAENFRLRFSHSIGLQEYTLRFDDGILLDCEVIGNILCDKNERAYGIVFVIRDISERKRIEQQLRESEERFRVIFENAAIGVALVDMQGYPIKSNIAFRTMLGYSEKELSQMTFAQFTHPDDVAEDVNLYQELIEELRSNYQIEKRYYAKDGTIVWGRLHVSLVNDGNSQPRFAVGIVEDITKHKFAEQALLESEKRYRDLVETMPDGVYRSTHEGKFVEVNQAMVKILGYDSKEEIKNIDIKTELYFQPGDRESAELDEQNAEMAIFRLRKKDGSEIWVEDHGRLVVDDHGTILYHEGILRDISARKEAEAERKNLETRLFQAQKLESIGTLAAGIAHDFNNILNVIMGNVSRINGKQLMDEAKLKRRVEVILNATERGAQLVNQLLTYARKTDIEQQSILLNDLVDETVGLLKETFPKTIETSITLQPDLPTIQGDLNQLHQVLMNLCVNSRDAMPNGGKLSITTETIPLQMVRARFLNASAPKYVLMTVKDSGTGMDEHTQKKIFDPFFTTKDKGKGTGLGLAVVFGIIDNHNGFIEVASRLGEGSEFRVYLPALEILLEPKISVGPTITDFHGNNETILIAEDDLLGRELIQEILTENGYNIIVTENGDEAINEFEKNIDRIALVLSDLDLPKSDGEKVCKRIKAMSPDIPLIVMSGFVDMERIETLNNCGINDIILKPYSIDDLLMRIKIVLNGKSVQ